MRQLEGNFRLSSHVSVGLPYGPFPINSTSLKESPEENVKFKEVLVACPGKLRTTSARSLQTLCLGHVMRDVNQSVKLVLDGLSCSSGQIESVFHSAHWMSVVDHLDLLESKNLINDINATFIDCYRKCIVTLDDEQKRNLLRNTLSFTIDAWENASGVGTSCAILLYIEITTQGINPPEDLKSLTVRELYDLYNQLKKTDFQDHLRHLFLLGIIDTYKEKQAFLWKVYMECLARLTEEISLGPFRLRHKYNLSNFIYCTMEHIDFLKKEIDDQDLAEKASIDVIDHLWGFPLAVIRATTSTTRNKALLSLYHLVVKHLSREPSFLTEVRDFSQRYLYARALSIRDTFVRFNACSAAELKGLWNEDYIIWKNLAYAYNELSIWKEKFDVRSLAYDGPYLKDGKNSFMRLAEEFDLRALNLSPLKIFIDGDLITYSLKDEFNKANKVDQQILIPLFQALGIFGS